ncbi:hypothetical protein [Caulobacter mirabilis]|nr:hypothetical protein [Caulobacter mirabilis]
MLGGAAIGISSSIAGRLAQRYLPTKLEVSQAAWYDAQRARMDTDLDLYRDRMRLAEEQFQTQIAEARERLIEDHRNRKEQIAYAEQLRRWDLPFRPENFLLRSSKRGVQSLNIIALHADFRPSQLRLAGDTTAIDGLLDGTRQASDRLLQLYGGPVEGHQVVFYRDRQVRDDLDMQSLVTDLSGLLSTEPTLVIALGPEAQDSYKVTLAHWGLLASTEPNPVVAAPFSVSLAHHGAGARLDVRDTMMRVTAALAIASADAYFALRVPHELPQPRLTDLMGHLLPDEVTWSWGPLTASYADAVQKLRGQNPGLAAELAAGAALGALEAGNPTYAGELLDLALGVYPWPGPVNATDGARYEHLVRIELPRRAQSNLRIALERLRSFTPPTNIRSAADDLNTSASRLGPRGQRNNGGIR